MRREKNALLQRERREKETNVERRERQAMDAFNHRQQRQQTAFFRAARFENEIPPENYIGKMDSMCRHCNALHFRNECVSGRKEEFKQCCHYGSVQLPQLRTYPDEMKALLQGMDMEGKNFRENIRSYNSALAFASMGALIDLPQGFGPYCFRIHGQIYHRIGPLHPASGQKAQFGQLYILDSSLALKERMGNVANDGCLTTTMKKLGEILMENSPFAAAYKMMYEVEQEEIARAEKENRAPPPVRMVFDINQHNYDQRRYNHPRANEVAAVFVGEDGDVPKHRHVAVHSRDQSLKTISILHAHCDPMVYPILFPCGDEGWYPELEKIDQSRNRKRVSMLQFYSYRLAIRQSFNPIHYGGKLFQQYIVDAYVKTEQNRLAFHRQNQKALRVELYKGLMDHLANEAELQGLKPGRVIILPSSFQGGPRAMQQNYQDAMAIVRKYGKPDLFITFTCNPRWKEIEEQLLPGQTPSDRPDLISRVFKLKLDELLNDIFKKHILGRTVAHVFVIEFQKRGLPHCHMLIILTDEDKPKDNASIDHIVASEIPDPVQFPRLHEIVKKHMIHGPCGILNRNSPCMDDGKCSKDFPKEFSVQTTTNKDGYPRYRRRDNGITVNVGKYDVDNRWVVPYNPYLLMKYNAHINVEVCATVKSIKYLFKYIYKGHDCANIKLERPVQEGASAQRTLEWDEIKTHLDARYVSAPEASWRLFEFPLHDKSHSIVRLAVHLPNMQPVYFAEGNEQNALEKAGGRDTTLTAWFKLNIENPDARQYLYHDIPHHFVFNREGKWKRRQQGDKIIGRMYSVSPSDVERYHLRILLLYTPGACSFDDLKKTDTEICQTFADAAKKRGLICDDTEYEKCMTEAIVFQMPRQLRMLFCLILLYCNPTNPKNLWYSFKMDMAEDFLQHFDTETAEAMLFHVVEEKLKEQGRCCGDFDIPSPSISYSFEEEFIDKKYDLQIGQEMYQMLNQDQRLAAEQILEAVRDRTTTTISCFFIDGPGGTGKTYLYNTLCRLLKGQGICFITVAWTGIAANLLPDGRTAHNRFKLPVPLIETSTSSIRPNSKDAQAIREAEIFIWDEAPMAPSYALKAVDILLRDIMNVDVPFGGKVMVLGGDFRQVLPVVRFATNLN